jgi:hypothetical protein
MSGDREADILQLIEQLKNDIDLARKHSLGHTAKLLKMALLDARMTAHSISKDELELFSDALESAAHPDPAEMQKN